MVDFVAARVKMIDNQLRTTNVTDHRILAAMGEVPREAFLPAGQGELAYADVAHPLGSGRFLPPPAPFARLVQLAEITAGDRVLDIGAGTGYGTAVLARLAAEVVGIEPDAELAGKAEANLKAGGVSNASIETSGFEGTGLQREHFDAIIVEGQLEAEPTHLFGLLRDGGRLVALISNGGPGVAHVFVRSGEEVAGRSEFNASLPPLAAAPRPDTFVF